MHRTPKNTLFTLFLIVPYYVHAGQCTQSVAKIESIQGKVHRQAPNQKDWQTILREDTLCSGDKIRTAKWSRATLVLNNKAIITLDQNSTLSLAAPRDGKGSWLLKLMHGISFFRSRQPQQLHIETPFVNAVHDGTEFLVNVDQQQTQISVIDGQVSAQNANGNVKIGAGFTGVAAIGQAPHLQALTISPADAVQWTLYYPPLIDFAHNKDFPVVLQAYQQGDIAQALTALEQTPQTDNPEYLTLKAALLISVGRVDEAQPLLRQSRQLPGNNSNALALQAVIAVAKNQQQSALDLANQAVTANPHSAVAKIAQSYAYQALFNIDA
ncbi:MAG: FecR domain-containing protein, partial [Methylococcales bacterium]